MFSNTYIIYADVLFLLNFLLDFALLWVSGRFLRLPISLWRLLLASFCGALYGAAILIPGLAVFYSLAVKLLFPAILLIIAFPFRGIRSFMATMGIFYLMSFAMAGAALGGSTILSETGIQIDGMRTVRGASLIFALAVAIILAKRGIQKIRKSWKKEDFQVKIEIIAGGRSCVLQALIDTGNELYDPVSGKPVIVGEYAALSTLLPQGIRQAVSKFGEHDPAKVLEYAAIDGWERRLRLVPFASIGKTHGLLLGFRPDNVIIHNEDKLQNKNVIVCFYQRKFPQAGGYKAIVNPDVLELLEKKKEVSA